MRFIRCDSLEYTHLKGGMRWVHSDPGHRIIKQFGIGDKGGQLALEKRKEVHTLRLGEENDRSLFTSAVKTSTTMVNIDSLDHQLKKQHSISKNG